MSAAFRPVSSWLLSLLWTIFSCARTADDTKIQIIDSERPAFNGSPYLDIFANGISAQGQIRLADNVGG